MGKLVHRVLGDARGKVGNLVFKLYDGKVYISSHKGFNKISKSSACVNNRKKFAIAIKFSKAINSLSGLKEVWKQSKADGKRTYSKILSSNIDKILDGKLSKLNSIAPKGFKIDAKDLEFNQNSMSLSLKINDAENDYSNITFKLNFVIALLSTNQNVDKQLFPYLGLSVDFTADDISEYKNVTVNFNSAQSELIGMFEKAKVFLALTKTDVEPCINSCSASFDECVF
jgi:hypothetical protein